MPGPKSAFGPVPEEWSARITGALQGSPRSHPLYVQLLHRLYHRAGATDTDVLDAHLWLRDPEALVRTVLGDVKPATQAIYVKAVLNLLLGLVLQAQERGLDRAALSDVYRDWILLYNRLQGEARASALQTRRVQSLPPDLTLARLQEWLAETAQEIRSWPPLEDEGRRRRLLQHVYVALMVGSEAFPPIRGEFARMRILARAPAPGPSPVEGNYLVLPPRRGEGKMVLQEHKMLRKYGPHACVVPEPLCQLLRLSLRLFPRDYVLSLLRDGSAPLAELSNLTDVPVFAGRPPVALGPSTLRAIFVRDYASRQSMARQKEIARAMLHDIKTSFAVYQG